jgi:hypothetical protein
MQSERQVPMFRRNLLSTFSEYKRKTTFVQTLIKFSRLSTCCVTEESHIHGFTWKKLTCRSGIDYKRTIIRKV